MGEVSSEDDRIANKLVQDTIAIVTGKSKLNEECGTLDSEELKSTLNETRILSEQDDDIIEEDIKSEPENSPKKLNLTTESSEGFHDSLEEDNRSVSSKSSTSKSSKPSSSSSSSSSSSTSSASQSSDSDVHEKTPPARLAKTFRKNDLVNELNKTRIVNKSAGIPVIEAKKIKGKKSAPKINSWIDPNSVKGTPNDEKKLKEWMERKDKETIEKRDEVKKQKKEEEIRQREEYEMKQQLQKKNFEQWENKKKEALERKMKQSEELKARRKEKKREDAEKLKYSEKAFQNWKARKEEKIKEETKVRKRQESQTKEEQARLKEEKDRDQRKAFERWCENQKKIEEQKRTEKQKIREAEEELELLQEYRRQDAEEEYIQWKKEKTLNKTIPKSVVHPLGWAPAGKSDGRHRMSPNHRPTSPGEPLSKTLAGLQNEPSYNRRLKTIEVCCRKISFWCHCPSANCSVRENGSPYEFNRSHGHPLDASTPKSSPFFRRRNEPSFGDGSNGRFSPLQNLSRHTTPVSSRPSTPRRR